MWLRTNRTLINLDRVQSFESCTRPDKTEFVYANFAGSETTGERELVCVCQPEDVQPLLNAIADALLHDNKVFSVPEWLDYHRQHKEDSNVNPF